MRVESGRHSRVGFCDVCLVALCTFLLWIRADKSKRIVSSATACSAVVRFCKWTTRRRRLPSMSQHPLLQYARFQTIAFQSSISGNRSLLLASRLPDAIMLPRDDRLIWCNRTVDSFSVIRFLPRLVLALLKYLLLTECWNCPSSRGHGRAIPFRSRRRGKSLSPGPDLCPMSWSASRLSTHLGGEWQSCETEDMCA
jgi:hypothetical protein